MYRSTVKLGFKSFVSPLLAVLLLAASVSAQTTSPNPPASDGAPGVSRERRVKDDMFREELLRQLKERRNEPPNIKKWEDIGPDDAGVATENRTGEDTKSEVQESEPTKRQEVNPNRTIIVHSLDDDGPGTLRQALREASDGNTINIVVKGTITLTSGELVVDKSVTIRGHGADKLTVSGNFLSRVFHITPNTTVTISGLTITNGSVFGSFPVNAGGGIYNDHATLTVSSCIVSGNSARFGGGIFSNSNDGGTASLTINNSIVSGNASLRAGGGIFTGGGFFNTGPSGSATLMINNSTISANSTAAAGGGIFNDGFAGTATLVISNSLISGNNATAGSRAGGGIYNNGDSGVATVMLTSSTLSDNSARFGGAVFNDGASFVSPGTAKITLSNCTVKNNSTQNFGEGAGVYSAGTGTAIVTLTNCDVTANSGGAAIVANGRGSGTARLFLTSCNVENNIGGGIKLDDILCVVTHTRFIGNSSDGAGGAIKIDTSFPFYLHSSEVTLTNSTLSSNTARFSGGGIYNGGNKLDLVNSTISGNSAGALGGGIINVADENTKTVTLTNSTVSGNSASFGGGILNVAVGGDGVNAIVKVRNSTLSNNSGNFGGGIVTSSQGGATATVEIANTILNAGTSGENIAILVEGTVTSLGYNLSSDAAGGDGSTGPGGLLNGPGDIRNTNPHLGPLQNNGGPTMTHALLSYSPAIDAGDPNFNPNAFDPPLLYDQRGHPFRRVVNGCVDIGAFELKHGDDDDDDDDDP